MNINNITIPQKLEALQAVVDNPDIAPYDIPYHFYADDIIDNSTPCQPTDKGRALWERFTRHLNTGYKTLTTGERIFWLTKYTGENQPDNQTLLNIVRTTSSTEIRDAAVTYYAAHQCKHGVTDEWRPVLTNILEGYTKASVIVAPIVDEQLIRHAANSDAIAAWLTAHPKASDPLIHRWLHSGDGLIVAAVVRHIDPARLPLIDVDRIVSDTWSNINGMSSAFASVARYLTIPQLNTLLDHGVIDMLDTLIFGSPFSDEQWEMFDKRDHESVKGALWEYRRDMHSLQKERERLFINPDCKFAARVDKSCLSPTWEDGDDWTTM